MGCVALKCVPTKVMNNQKFCVRMENCPGMVKILGLIVSNEVGNY